MSDNRTISEKDHYHELTPKMKAVVDAIAAEPGLIQEEYAERASEELANDPDTDVDSVNRSYVSVIKNTYPHIIQQQKEQYDNARSTGGEETAEGNPLESMDAQIGRESQGVSTIQNRDKAPGSESQVEQGQESRGDTTESAEPKGEGEIPVTLTREEAMELASSGCSTSLQKRLLAQLVDSKAKASA